jgi:dUTP pyrophosphatase
MFRVEDKVFIKGLKKKGVVKEIDQEKKQYLVTYFIKNEKENEPDIRKLDWFKFRDVDKYRPKDEILFAKVKPNAVIPSKRSEDGNYDIYSCIDETITINPGEIQLIPTGIASSFSSKYRFSLRERGSSGSRGLSKRCGEIDSGFRDEWFVAINNTSNKVIKITPLVDEIEEHEDVIFYSTKKAICQAALEFVPDVRIREISYEKLKNIPSKRGMGKLGDSGK